MRLLTAEGARGRRRGACRTGGRGSCSGRPGAEISTSGFERPDEGDGARLWNFAPLIPADRRFSRVFRGRGELIDRILVSQALVQQVERVDTGPGEPPSITEDPTARRDEPASDHLPVVARFRLE